MIWQFHSYAYYLEKTLNQKDICTPMFIAIQLTRVKTWKQPKCPSTDEWTKMWYIYVLWNIAQA